MPTDSFDDKFNQILSKKTYTEFKEALASSGCSLCTLSKARTHIVVDRGESSRGVVIVGEAPGENEDLQGKAFIGRAGKLLDKMLLSLGFDTNKESLIVNIAKCRPPDNRRPEKEEAAACAPYLNKQLELARPKIMVLLGATALKYLIPEKEKTAMRDVVGRFFTHTRFPGVDIMVIYHPAYLLRDPRKQPEALEHLKLFKKRFDELKG